MSQIISPKNHFTSGLALDFDYVYLSTQLDDLDPQDHWHTRLVFFDQQAEGCWSSRDINTNVVGICRYDNDPISRMLCALSKEGEVELLLRGVDLDVEKPSLEKIPDAGLRLGDNGYTTCIREIAGTLYVCGQNGQFYRRKGPNQWEHMDQGLFQGSVDDLPEGLEPIDLNSLDGTSASDLYTVGDGGCIYHFDGVAWKQIPCPVTHHLQQVRCYGPDEVWICGYNHTVLKGNARDGFKLMLPSKPGFPTWWSLVKFQGHIYLANSNGLFRMTLDGHMDLVKSGLKPEISTYKLDAIDGPDGALWSFGAKDLTRFDGKKWERFQDPDNDPIR